ncbi:MAG: hypothetical protein ABIJ27_07020 [Candidatus Omnitrophota bacterium]
MRILKYYGIFLIGAALACLIVIVSPAMSQYPSESTTPAPVAGVEGSSGAQGVLDTMIDRYKDRDPERFIDLVTREYRSGYSALQSTVENDLENHRDITLTYNVIAESKQGDSILLNVYWRKLWADTTTGTYGREEGTASLTFINTRNGYLLIDQEGDDMF